VNTLYYGDNLNILREHIPTESVDLIYLEPRSNEGRKDDAEKDRWETLPTDAVRAIVKVLTYGANR
jgi:hypothetical protein